jgi:hypothetical protein
MAEVLRFYTEDGEVFYTDSSPELLESFKMGGSTFTLDDGRVLTGKIFDSDKMH